MKTVEEKGHPDMRRMILLLILTLLLTSCAPGSTSPDAPAGQDYIRWIDFDIPEPALTRALLRHYGPADSMNFLHNTYFNLKRPDLLRKVAERTAQLLREERADQHHVEKGAAEDRKQ